MKALQCDNCGKLYDIVDEEARKYFFVLDVSGEYMEDGKPKSLDVCSTECLVELARALNGQEDQPELPVEDHEMTREVISAEALRGAPYLGEFEGQVRVR